MSRGLPFEFFLGLRYLRARGQRTNLSLFGAASNRAACLSCSM